MKNITASSFQSAVETGNGGIGLGPIIAVYLNRQARLSYVARYVRGVIEQKNLPNEIREEVSHLLKNYYYDLPSLNLSWAGKLFSHQRKDEACVFVYLALQNVRYDNKDPTHLLSQAIKLLKRNRLNDIAVELQDFARKRFPNDAYFKMEIIKDLLRHGQLNQAIQALEEAHAQHPQDPSVANLLGTTYIFSKRTNDAIPVLESLLKMHPQDSRLITTLGMAYTEMSRAQDALNLLEEACKNLPIDGELISVLGNVYRHVDRLDDSIELLEAGKRKFPEHPNISHTLCQSYLQAQRLEDAVAVYETEQKKRPSKVNIRAMANVYVILVQRAKFEAMKPFLKEESLKDYLEAKLCYFEGSMQKAVKIITPYIQDTTAWEKHSMAYDNMAALLLACLSDDHPLHQILPSIVGEAKYQYLIERREEWRANPRRIELIDPGFTSLDAFYDLGAMPASGADRQKAGMRSGDVPVAVKITDISTKLAV